MTDNYRVTMRYDDGVTGQTPRCLTFDHAMEWIRVQLESMRPGAVQLGVALCPGCGRCQPELAQS